ncbi:MAG: ComEA family DNA-binding protein [Phascolarctobacterium sp.]|nr:ComEA family DNA-binding protein [Phascolarctobacterium sp.]
MDNKTKKGLMLCALVLLCGLTSLLSNLFSRGEEKLQLLPNKQVNINSDNRNKNKNEAYGKNQVIKVYVSGAVVSPGIYEVKGGARANDAVMAAGGLLDNADTQKVNLALKLKDGMQVNVPFVKNSFKGTGGKSEGFSKQRQATSKNDHRRPDIVNINTASINELVGLPGIGPSMAQRIINYRERKPFRSIEDIVKVPGIGKAKLEMLRERIRVCIKLCVLYSLL